MDGAIFSTGAALVGSLIGGASTLAASWVTQRGQLRAQALVHEATKREALYAEFIIEATKRFTDAWNHHLENPTVLAGLYSAMQRMRLSSTDVVIEAAREVLRTVLEAYDQPERTFEELRERVRADAERDALQAFAEACRIELRALRV